MATRNPDIETRFRPARVLITRFSAIGDVAMTIPVVYSVARSNPEVKFVMVTRPSMATMFLNPPDNLTVRGIDLSSPVYKGLTGLHRLYRELRREYDFDAVADLHDVLRTMALDAMAWLNRIPVSRINKERSRKRALTRRHNKIMLPLISQRARYREVFHRLGLAVEERFRSLFGDGKGNPADFASITAPKTGTDKWVGIAPFAKHKGKIYPPGLMEKVVAALAAKGDVKIFLFGGGDHEREIFAGWAARYPGVISLADKHHGFPVELSLLSHLDVMVSMDSANMHLASLVGVPVISVWGATHPYCGFKGWKQQDTDTVQLTMTCRPCSVFGDKPCFRGDYHCLNGISPQSIVDKINARINQ